jgi:hypothetical protein
VELMSNSAISGETVDKIELLNQIKQKLDEARGLAAEGGGVLAYFIEMAVIEADEMILKAQNPGGSANKLDQCPDQ